MGSIDIEVGLTEEEVAVRDTVHKFAVEVLRPAGAKLDKLADPADVIAPGSILWEVFEKYHQLGIPGLRGDPGVDAVAQRPPRRDRERGARLGRRRARHHPGRLRLPRDVGPARPETPS